MFKIKITTNQSKIGKAFTKVHLAMVRNKTPLQIIYPEYSLEYGIGGSLIILGSKEELLNLNLQSGGDYIVSEVSEANNNDMLFSFKRKHEKINNARIRRAVKRAKERGEVIDEKEYRKNMLRKTLSLPFLSIPSASTGQHFKLFVERVDFKEITPDFYGMVK